MQIHGRVKEIGKSNYLARKISSVRSKEKKCKELKKSIR